MYGCAALTRPPPFEIHSLPWNQRCAAWTKWRKSMHIYFAATGVTSPTQKFGLLMYLGGTDLQDLYEYFISTSRDNVETEDEYEAAVRSITEYFNPTPAVNVKRNIERKTSELQKENVVEPRGPEIETSTKPAHANTEDEPELQNENDEYTSAIEDDQENNISEEFCTKPEIDKDETESLDSS